MAMKLVLCFAISHLLRFSAGFNFSVGGEDGWVLHPSEDYSHWSSRNRFLVNDTLYFRYKKGEDSVLEVTKDDYYNCDTSNWVMKSDNGSSEFVLDRSGPFFFISGVKRHCDKGQKLLIIVLSESHRHAVSPAAAPPVPSFPATISPVPAPSLPSVPVQSPAPAPANSPAPALSPESAPPPSTGGSSMAAASAMTPDLPISISLIFSSFLFAQL